ncbi:gamma-glutamylcyclotransferase family protein [Thalassoporum mexicanum]|uniref:gamma-glutamylcyclotransferase family protein n=1 Tax=Thalassoporum mexicanum TaxID=3457544 RepID=UPI0002D4AE83|nr:gamma-glutamylcyclotransferase family protein [Pseudanabaena sp. PCC 7367]
MAYRYYFGYGSNIVIAGMQERCPGAILVGVAELPNNRFLINSQGVATVVQSPVSKVYGVVWQITPDHEAVLDDYEDIDLELYERAIAQVNLLNLPIDSEPVAPIEALIYIATDELSGIPMDGYLEEIVEAAIGHSFPDYYVQELKEWFL